MKASATSATRGLIIVNAGNGKGETTAALRLMMCAWGQGMKEVMLQYIKRATANYGEDRAARRMGIELVAGGGRLRSVQARTRTGAGRWLWSCGA